MRIFLTVFLLVALLQCCTNVADYTGKKNARDLYNKDEDYQFSYDYKGPGTLYIPQQDQNSDNHYDGEVIYVPVIIKKKVVKKTKM